MKKCYANACKTSTFTIKPNKFDELKAMLETFAPNGVLHIEYDPALSHVSFAIDDELNYYGNDPEFDESMCVYEYLAERIKPFLDDCTLFLFEEANIGADYIFYLLLKIESGVVKIKTNNDLKYRKGVY